VSGIAAGSERIDVDVGHRLILVVDDDVLVLTNSVALLEDLGHAVKAAASGVEALGLVRREAALDLVITDQVMPGMSGVELAAAIRLLRPELPVILATGFAELPREAAAQLPRLAKPFTQLELAQLIARVLSESS